jgi:hypothetical protein
MEGPIPCTKLPYIFKVEMSDDLEDGIVEWFIDGYFVDDLFAIVGLCTG